jgi:GntR family transcriptional regulator, histidine utilization repressor
VSRQRASWRVIREELVRRIAVREWEPGTLIPGEETLAVEFGASRATVNRAMQDLASKGLIERKRKAGSRVAANPVREARFVIPLVRVEVEKAGAVYGYTLLSRQVVSASDIIRARLQLPANARLLHLRCLHLADRAPYQYEDRWISLDAVPSAQSADFETIGPNEWLVANAPFSDAEYAFFAAAASPDEAAALGLAAGAPVFVGERLTWLAGAPVTLVRMVHPPSHRVVTRL